MLNMRVRNYTFRPMAATLFALCVCASQAVRAADPPPAIIIDSYEPHAGAVGAGVSVNGFNFTADNTIHFGSAVIEHVAIKSSLAIACRANTLDCRAGIHQFLEFTVPSGAGNGTLDLWIENVNGRSPVLPFDLIAAAPR